MIEIPDEKVEEEQQQEQDMEIVDLISKNEGTNTLKNEKAKTVEEATDEAAMVGKKQDLQEMREPRKEWIQNMKV